MPSNSPSVRLTLGFGEFLTAAELGEFDSETVPLDAEWPIVGGPDMPTEPDRLIVVSAMDPTYVRATATAVVQVRLRGARDEGFEPVAEQAEAIRLAFTPNGFPLVHRALGDLRVGEVRHLNGLLLTPDASRRWGHIQNFRVRFRP